MDRSNYHDFMVIGVTKLLTAMLTLAAGAAFAAENARSTRTMGWQALIGKGTVFSYAKFDAAGAPDAMGIAFSPEALEGLPPARITIIAPSATPTAQLALRPNASRRTSM